MQNTRLTNLIDGTIARSTRWLRNPWRRLSVLIISVLLGNFTATVVSTTTGQAADLDVLVAGILVAITELISWLQYGRFSRRESRQGEEPRSLFQDLLNGLKVGLTYGLFVEAFKLRQLEVDDASLLHTALSDLARANGLDSVYATLTDLLMRDRSSMAALGIWPDGVQAHVAERSRWFQTLLPHLERYCQTKFGWPSLPLEPLWQLWLPLAQQISARQLSLRRPYVQGILGLQGTGKTTLAVLLAEILTQMGHQVGQLSVDDLYLPYADRVALQQVDPRFRWRGPPGTHDVELGLAVLRQVRSGPSEPIAIPRFDKSLHGGAGDRTAPDWVTGLDILLFEGWFVGVRPVDPAVFDTAPPPIKTEGDRQFARDINQRLHDYLPLWDQLDSLIVLYPSDYHLSREWRRQAERQMAATGRSAMSDDEIDQFVNYFWRSLHPALFVEPLLHDAEHVEWVIRVKGDRSLDLIQHLRNR